MGETCQLRTQATAALRSLDRLVSLRHRRQFESHCLAVRLYPASGSSGSACSRSRRPPVALNQQIESCAETTASLVCTEAPLSAKAAHLVLSAA
jgi:hypothetical protein